jgi:hypothetical protein
MSPQAARAKPAGAAPHARLTLSRQLSASEPFPNSLSNLVAIHEHPAVTYRFGNGRDYTGSGLAVHEPQRVGRVAVTAADELATRYAAARWCAWQVVADSRNTRNVRGLRRLIEAKLKLSDDVSSPQATRATLGSDTLPPRSRDTRDGIDA